MTYFAIRFGRSRPPREGPGALNLAPRAAPYHGIVGIPFQLFPSRLGQKAYRPRPFRGRHAQMPRAGSNRLRVPAIGAATKRTMSRSVPLECFLLVALQLAAGLTVAGCADDSLASHGQSNESRVPAATLEPYGGRAAELFDDAIEPAALGFALGVAADSDLGMVLRERTQTADAVVRARVITVTSNRGDDDRGWQIGLETVEGLAGARPPKAFSWLVRSHDPSAGVVRASEGRMVGTTLVAFLRDFAGTVGTDGPGPPQIHFHAAADSKSERDAVRAAAALSEFR